MELNALQMLRVLRGAPVTVLVALYLLQEAAGPKRLAEITGFSEKTVRKALVLLVDIGVVTRVRRYDAWAVREREKFPFEREKFPFEREKIPFPDGSSSSIDLDLVEFITTTTTEGEREKLPFEREKLPFEREKLPFDFVEEAKVAVGALCAQGYPLEQARATVAVAVMGGRDLTGVIRSIQGWAAYCISAHGTGIRNRGAFIAARVRDGQDPPVWFEEDKDGESYERLKARYVPSVLEDVIEY